MCTGWGLAPLRGSIGLCESAQSNFVLVEGELHSLISRHLAASWRMRALQLLSITGVALRIIEPRCTCPDHVGLIILPFTLLPSVARLCGSVSQELRGTVGRNLMLLEAADAINRLSS